jgi:hypothetical protein
MIIQHQNRTIIQQLEEKGSNLKRASRVSQSSTVVRIHEEYELRGQKATFRKPKNQCFANSVVSPCFLDLKMVKRWACNPKPFYNHNPNISPNHGQGGRAPKNFNMAKDIKSLHLNQDFFKLL